ncbi:MAG: phage late control D family protein [Blastocatellia bacterium]
MLLDGRELPLDVMVDVLDVTVSDYVTGGSWFCVTMNNWHSDRQEFKHIDGPRFKEGTKLEVTLGYDGRIVSLIKGEVTTLEPEFSENEAPTLKVQGYDSLHRLRRGLKTKSYVRLKDSDIARQIASGLGLSAQVDDTGVTHEYLLQDNQTDIDFLMGRARRIRYELAIENNVLHFRKATNDRDKVVSLEYGFTLRSFYPRLNTSSQVSEVLVQGWDAKIKKAITGRARSGDEVSKMGGRQLGASITESAFFATKNIITGVPVSSEGEANQIARGKFNDMAVEFITGEGTAIGNGDIKAGKVIELLKLGRRFSGLYYITSATHVIDSAGYSTKFTVERNAT